MDLGLWSGCLKANKAALKIYQRHPAWGFSDPDTYAMESIAAVHWNREAARSAGLPAPYDLGAQRQSWVIQLLINWMEDQGWLKRCYCEYRAFVFLSDVVWLRGKVTGKSVDENGEFCIEIETSGFNQRGENTIPGKGAVIPPSRDRGTDPVEKRLKRA